MLETLRHPMGAHQVSSGHTGDGDIYGIIQSRNFFQSIAGLPSVSLQSGGLSSFAFLNAVWYSSSLRVSPTPFSIVWNCSSLMNPAPLLSKTLNAVSTAALSFFSAWIAGHIASTLASSAFPSGQFDSQISLSLPLVGVSPSDWTIFSNTAHSKNLLSSLSKNWKASRTSALKPMFQLPSPC